MIKPIDSKILCIALFIGLGMLFVSVVDYFFDKGPKTIQSKNCYVSEGENTDTWFCVFEVEK